MLPVVRWLGPSSASRSLRHFSSSHFQMPPVAEDEVVVRERKKSVQSPASNIAKSGETILLHFTGKIENGDEIESTRRCGPVEFTLGSGQFLSCLESEIDGMVVGEKKQVVVSPADAYGQRNENLVMEAALSTLPKNTVVGSRVFITFPGEQSKYPMIVKAIGTEAELQDANHPLAGKTLYYNIELDALLNEAGKKLSGGVRLETFEPGDGENRPGVGDRILMHYSGTIARTGVHFDSSRSRNKPFECTIGVGNVIAGWDVGVMGMTLGERAILHIPSHMGYGSKSNSILIPNNSDLKFDVELLRINDLDAPQIDEYEGIPDAGS